MRVRNKFTIFILILGALVGILGYYYYQRNIYSKEIVRLEILGEDQVQAFQEIEYLVKYKNNGNVVLEEVELIFQYPENSLPSAKTILRVVKNLEDIYPGEEGTLSFKTRLLGREGETKKAQAILRYRPKNLKPFYESQTSFTSRIKSLPLTFELDLPSRVESGKEIQFFLNYFSNSEWPLANLRVKIEYPPGFEFALSRPQALEKTEWDIPLLNKTEGGRIEIRGKLLGEIKEQKNFRAELGLWQEGEFILLKEITKGTELIRPALSVFQQVNGSGDYIANPGQVLHYEIFFRNIGSEPFQDLFLVAKLESPAFDFETLRTESGQFNKGDNFILWDWRQVPKLKFLQGGEEGKVEFWITLKNDWDTSSQSENFSLRNQVIVSQVREDFETKINSRLEISQKGYVADEIFGSSGSFPPRVGQTATLTIIWQAKNYYNDMESVKVKATLPPFVRLTGKIFPEAAPLTFDSISREIVWSLDKMEAGAGIRKPAPNVAFQVAVTPQDDVQASQSAATISQVQILGQDVWTGKVLEATQDQITIGAIQ